MQLHPAQLTQQRTRQLASTQGMAVQRKGSNRRLHPLKDPMNSKWPCNEKVKVRVFKKIFYSCASYISLSRNSLNWLWYSSSLRTSRYHGQSFPTKTVLSRFLECKKRLNNSIQQLENCIFFNVLLRIAISNTELHLLARFWPFQGQGAAPWPKQFPIGMTVIFYGKDFSITISPWIVRVRIVDASAGPFIQEINFFQILDVGTNIILVDLRDVLVQYKAVLQTDDVYVGLDPCAPFWVVSVVLGRPCAPFRDCSVSAYRKSSFNSCN